MEINPESKKIEHLVLLAQSGDHKALDRLLQSIQTPIFHYLCKITNDVELSEDILQEVFILVFRKLWLLREPRAFHTWVYKIASRTAFYHIKKEKDVPILLDEQMANLEAKQILEHVDLLQEEPNVEEMIAKTSVALRSVLFLRFIDGKSLGEISTILEIPLGTVKSRLANGILQLKKMVKKQVRIQKPEEI